MFLTQSKDCTEMIYAKQEGLKLEIYGPKLLYEKLSLISGQNKERVAYSIHCLLGESWICQ